MRCSFSFTAQIFCTYYWISFKNSLNDKSLIKMCSMSFCSRFQGLVWDLQVHFWKTVPYGTVHKNLIFNTVKTSNHFGHENKSQKNTISPCWMKLLVVQVEKTKVISQNFVSNSFLNSYIWCSCQFRLGGLHYSLLIFSKLIWLTRLYIWLSNTLWLFAFFLLVHN